jgi:hypothetical protein
MRGVCKKIWDLLKIELASKELSEIVGRPQ